MNKLELIALDDRRIGAWDTYDVDSFAAMFADDFVHTDDTVEGTVSGTPTSSTSSACRLAAALVDGQ